MPRQIDADTILSDARITLSGVAGSAYTPKMRAVLRDRQIPYRLLIASNVASGELTGLPVHNPSLLPTYFLPADDRLCDAGQGQGFHEQRHRGEYSDRRQGSTQPSLARVARRYCIDPPSGRRRHHELANFCRV